MPYYLGIDVGGTKTQALIINEKGDCLGIGSSGPGNHEVVGYDGFRTALLESSRDALFQANLKFDNINNIAAGISGLDWPSQKHFHQEIIDDLGWKTPCRLYNDAIIGLAAGASQGWGIVIIAGTGSNCYGLTKDQQKIGRVTGCGSLMGEAAGGADLVHYAIKEIAKSWAKRSEPTLLSDLFLKKYSYKSVSHLIEAWGTQKLLPDPSDAPLIFQGAEYGDQAAKNIIVEVAMTLADMVCGVVKQLDFQESHFDVVAMGGLFKQSKWLTPPFIESLHEFAPKANIVHLAVPPVVGAAILAHPKINDKIRNNIISTL